MGKPFLFGGRCYNIMAAHLGHASTKYTVNQFILVAIKVSVLKPVNISH